MVAVAAVFSVVVRLDGDLVVPDDRGRLGAAVYACMGRVMDGVQFVLLHGGLRYKPFVFHVSGVPADCNGTLMLRSPVVFFRSLWRECADAFARGVAGGFPCGGQLVPVADVCCSEWVNPWAGARLALGLKVLGWVCVSRPEGVTGRKRCVAYEADDGAFVFSGLVAANLARKARAFGLAVSPEEVEFAFDPWSLRRAKRNGAKVFKVNGGRVIAYRAPAVLVCPGALVPVVLGCGLGERNAQGFGYVEIAGVKVVG